MGALEEINKQAQKAFPLFMDDMIAGLNGALATSSSFFPLVVRADFSKETENAETKSKLLADLYDNSKNVCGRGYSLQIEVVNTRSKGRRKVLKRILFENKEDYLSFLSGKDECEGFTDALVTLLEEGLFSKDQLKNWAWDHLRELCECHKENFWLNACTVAKWLKNNPNSGLFIREIPLDLDKTFIEENKALIHSLVTLNPIKISFEADHGLLGRQSSLRFKAAGKDLELNLCKLALSEVTLSIQDFCRLNQSELFDKIKNVFIIENEMVYLTFPETEKSLCIFCRGYTANILKLCEWLSEKEIFYFGDIEVYSFDILSSLRSYFTNIQSFCMDEQTLTSFSDRIQKNQNPIKRPLPLNLTDQEKEAYSKLRNNSDFLELKSECISIEYIKEKLKNLFSPKEY